MTREAARTIEIVNGRPIAAVWLPGEVAIVAEMSRLDWCRDTSRLFELGRERVALRTAHAERDA